MFRRAFASVAGLAAFAAALSPGSGTPAVAGTRGVVAAKIAAVGDIACAIAPLATGKKCRYDAVASKIAAGGYDRFLALGDEQYASGSTTEFANNYDVYFNFNGLNTISAPVPGNHEYATTDAAGFFSYFSLLTTSPGYFSFDLSGWHIIALNSQLCPLTVGCVPGDAQYDWLAADLAAHPNDTYPCTLAYWHHPRFGWQATANPGDLARSTGFWDLLYSAQADVVLNGHHHNYSRWAPMDPSGKADPAGLTQFIMGTGGKSLNLFGSLDTKPSTLLASRNTDFGYLEMTLHQSSYDFRWVSIKQFPKFADSDTGIPCH